MGMGALDVILTLAIYLQTYNIWKNKVIFYAQPDFIDIILDGLLMVSVGDVVYPTDTSLITCAAKQWLVIFVFSLDLTPLTVKVYAIDTLIQQAKK